MPEQADRSAVPPALRRDIDGALTSLGRPGVRTLEDASSDDLLEAAARVYRSELDGGCTGRRSALALLVVDALVTYAFERFSGDPREIERRAERAMIELAALVRPAVDGRAGQADA